MCIFFGGLVFLFSFYLVSKVKCLLLTAFILFIAFKFSKRAGCRPSKERINKCRSFFKGKEGVKQQQPNTPPTDIIETENSFVYEFELPGVSKENIKVEIEFNKLIISAERKSNHASLESVDFFNNIKCKEVKQFCKGVAKSVIKQQEAQDKSTNPSSNIFVQMAQGVCETLADDSDKEKSAVNESTECNNNDSSEKESRNEDSSSNSNSSSTNFDIKYILKENKLGAFKKEIEINSQNLNLTDINATFSNGLLIVTLLKKEPIKIKVL